MFTRQAFAPFAFSPVAFAIQELIAEIVSGKTIFQDTDQGIAPRNQKDYTSENLRRMHEQRNKPVPAKATEDYNLTRLHQEDAEAVDLLVALVTKGFFDV